MATKSSDPVVATSEPEPKSGGVTRRSFLKSGAVVTVAGVATGIKATGANAPPTVRWGMSVDLRKCVGCTACTVACKAENHTPPGVSYNRMEDEEFGTYPDVGRQFTFQPCMHCTAPLCLPACPIGAIYRQDGVVVLDYDVCQGYQLCIAACPYGSISFDNGDNYHENPTPYEEQPSPEYGQNLPRVPGQPPMYKGRKCSFCIHRVIKGLAPACAATCMGKAIHFGDLDDPGALCWTHGENLQDLLASRAHMRLKEEFGTEPSVYYLT